MTIREKALKALTMEVRKKIYNFYNEGLPTGVISDKLNIPEYYVVVALGRD